MSTKRYLQQAIASAHLTRLIATPNQHLVLYGVSLAHGLARERDIGIPWPLQFTLIRLLPKTTPTSEIIP